MKNLQIANTDTNTDSDLRMQLGLTLLGPLLTRDAWLRLVDSDKMDDWTALVHNYVFTTMLPLRTGLVIDAITSTVNSCDRVLVSTFRGMLSYKLPACKLHNQTDGQKRRAAILASSIITNVLIDQGLLSVEKERRVTASEVKEYHYVTFTRTNVKDKKHGVMHKPGVVMQKTVGSMSINKAQKDFIKLLSSQAFTLHSGLTTDILQKFYTLKDDWTKTHDKNGNLVQWKGPLKRAYYKDTALQIEELRDCIYYLPFKFDHRLRVGPEANSLEGINAHGKTLETLQHCSNDNQPLDSECIRAVKQQLYSARESRIGLDDAQVMLDLHHYDAVTDELILASTTQKEMANLYVAKKALETLERFENGQECNNLYGWDFTFSGGIMAGLLFKSPEFLKSGNLYGEDTITDAHANFGVKFGIEGMERDTVKDLQQPIMHGGHVTTLLKLLAQHDIVMDEFDVQAKVTDVYGECVTNISTIADWGVSLSCSEYSTMSWTLPDKLIGSHKAYQSGIAVDNYAASASHKSDYSHTVELTSLPYETTRTGKPLYAKEFTIGKTTHKVVSHLRGLFADILHSVDAYVLRVVVKAVRAEGHVILVKHDNFYVNPVAYPVLMRAAKKVFSEILASNLLEDILAEIAERSHIPAVAPTMIYGGAEDKIQESNLFLLP